jgi:pyruvate dehydrogenase E2 component (dihydrolipoamide acetyltransferase)
MTELTMPRLSDSMEQGTILTWLKADGDRVQAGEDLLEIETDKATVTHPAEDSGILQIIAAAGTTLPVGAPIARIGVGVAGDAPGRAAPASPAPASPAPAAAPSPDANGGPSAGKVSVPDNGDGAAAGTAVRATPLARRAAKLHGVSLEQVEGSGPLGRVTRGDVLTKAGVAPAAARPQPAPGPVRPQPAPSGRGADEVVEPTRRQALIARRMAEAKATIPHFQVQTDVAMDAAVAFRAQLKDIWSGGLSLNDLIVKAAALALREHPLANGSYRDGRFELHSRVNVGIAVAAEHALVVPTIFDADQKSLGAIAAESRRLAERVRDGTVAPSELSGATFTVSNLGMYGMTAITPVINPPQAAILGVGSVRETLARVDGEILDRRLMTLTLSCDHRILYGADAAEFLSAIRTLLEQPIRLAL